MEIDLIFKIAAIGIIVAVLNQLLDPFRPGRSGHDDDIGRARGRFVHSGQADQRIVCHHKIFICTMSLALSSLAIAVLAAVLYALFQKSAPTFSLLISMAAALILLARVGSAAQSVLSGLVRLEQRAGGDAYGCLLRCTGIVLLTDYARTLCEEAGAESLAWCAALAGRLLVLAAAWPLLEEIGQRIWSVLG